MLIWQKVVLIWLPKKKQQNPGVFWLLPGQRLRGKNPNKNATRAKGSQPPLFLKKHSQLPTGPQLFFCHAEFRYLVFLCFVRQACFPSSCTCWSLKPPLPSPDTSCIYIYIRTLSYIYIYVYICSFICSIYLMYTYTFYVVIRMLLKFVFILICFWHLKILHIHMILHGDLLLSAWGLCC